jgi:prohibitin 2
VSRYVDNNQINFVHIVMDSVLALVLLIVLFGSFSVIGPSERAVKVTLGTVTSEVYHPGLQFKAPIISSFRKFDLAPLTEDLHIEPAAGGAISSDNQTIGVTSKIVWSYDPNRIMTIVKQYPDTEILSKIVTNTVMEALKAEIGKHTIYDLAKNAGMIASATKSAATAKLKDYPVIFNQFNLTNWDWSEDFDKQINATMAARQRVETARAEADRIEQTQRAQSIQAEAEARATVAKAEGAKKAAELNAEAKRAEGQGISDYNRLIAQNLETELKFRQLEIDKIRAQKWNGVSVSQYVPLTAAGGIVALPEAK